MPYINHHGRDELDPNIDALMKHFEPETGTPWFLTKISGTINYIITRICLSLCPKSYSDYNTIIGILESCKLEFYRRAVAAYEDEKIKNNGDVYESKTV